MRGIDSKMDKTYFKKEFDGITKEFPDYTLAQIIYGIVTGVGINKISDIYDKTDKEILNSISKFKEIEREEHE